MQNIPTRFELGKRVRKVFKPEDGKVYIDSDYSQIELRVLASISEDKNMIQAFKEGQDIHKQAASKVFKTPIEEVTKEQRSNAKAVNFGIVYGISDFGLGEQLGIGRKKAKQYIEEYLEQYDGIKQFMTNITEKAKEEGYVETLFHRRRYIPELKSNNYMVRQFGSRAAMNTPIQGTAADIMKIAMIKVYEQIKQNNLKSKIVLQVHDEMMLEVPKDEQEQIEEIIKEIRKINKEVIIMVDNCYGEFVQEKEPIEVGADIAVRFINEKSRSRNCNFRSIYCRKKRFNRIMCRKINISRNRKRDRTIFKSKPITNKRTIFCTICCSK